MPHSKQAKKRMRQNEKHRIRNKSIRSEIKTLTKALTEKVKTDDAEGAETLFRKVTSKLDKAVKSHVFHKNAVARRKSKIATAVKGVQPAQAAKASPDESAEDDS